MVAKQRHVTALVIKQHNCSCLNTKSRDVTAISPCKPSCLALCVIVYSQFAGSNLPAGVVKVVITNHPCYSCIFLLVMCVSFKSHANFALHFGDVDQLAKT
jgi:hypothetical protein